MALSEFEYYRMISTPIHFSDRGEFMETMKKVLECKVKQLKKIDPYCFADPLYCFAADLTSFIGIQLDSLDNVKAAIDILSDSTKMSFRRHGGGGSARMSIVFETYRSKFSESDVGEEDSPGIVVRPYEITFEASDGRTFLLDHAGLNVMDEYIITFTFDAAGKFDSTKFHAIQTIKEKMKKIPDYVQGQAESGKKFEYSTEVKILKEIKPVTIYKHKQGGITYIPDLKEIPEEEKEILASHPDLQYHSDSVLYYCENEGEDPEDARDRILKDLADKGKAECDENDCYDLKSGENLPIAMGEFQFIKLDVPRSVLEDCVSRPDVSSGHLLTQDPNWVHLEKPIIVKDVIKETVLVPKEREEGWMDMMAGNREDFVGGSKGISKKLSVVESVIVFKISREEWENPANENIRVNIISKYQKDFSEDYGFYY